MKSRESDEIGRGAAWPKNRCAITRSSNDRAHSLSNLSQKRYTAEWSVDLSGMKRNSLPSEGLFNHACRLRRWETMAERRWRGKAETVKRKGEKSYTESTEKWHRGHRGGLFLLQAIDAGKR